MSDVGDQVGGPISMLVELCDRDARQALGMVPPGDGPWKPVTDHYRQYARAVIEAYVSRTGAEILSLSQERDRLREALTAIITENDGHWNEMGLGYAPDLPMIVNARAAIQKEPT